MSRIGKMPIDLADGVEVKIDGNNVTVKGAKGTLTQVLPEGIQAEVSENKLIVSPANDNDQISAFWGLGRSLLSNMVEGVSKGFTIKLEINGVGYRAAVKGKILELALGYSHPVLYTIPEGIEIKCPKPTEVEISGIDKQKVGQSAAVIRAYRKPEPYKGKGIKYADEIIRRKEGKKK